MIKGVRKRLALTAIGAPMMMALPATAAIAQSAEMAFDIPAGSLDYAITQVASQAGRSIAFDPALVRGRTVLALKGTMTPEAAAQRLLDGSGIMLRIEGGRWSLVRAAVQVAPAGGQVLGTVRVRAGTESLATAGANGSSDPLATEGTKSYTTRAQAIATKQPLTLKETPYAISVVTREALDDRAVVSFDDVLEVLPGVTTVDGGGETNRPDSIYSRGFALTNVQIDGGSPLAIGSGDVSSNYRIVDDLSIYDSVELQRGASGQFTGIGSPGGVLSLVRKRPLDHAALDVQLQAGSWNRLRSSIDVSSPVLLDGLVRARAVLTTEQNDEFYDFASRNFWQAYLNVEIDPSPDTIVNLGVKFAHNRSTPYNGLPTDKYAKLIDLPRSTCYCTDWGKAVVDGKEFFAQITQKLGADWSIHLNTSANLQTINSHYFNYVVLDAAGIDPDSVFPTTSANLYDAVRHSNQYLADAYVTGKTRLFGIGFDVTVGANFQKVNQRVEDVDRYYYYHGIPLLPFDAANFPDRTGADLVPGEATHPRSFQRQYGVYGTLRISPVDWIHLTIGERYTRYMNDDVTRYDYGGGDVSYSYSNIRYGILSPPNIGLTVDVTKDVTAFASYANIFTRGNYLTAAGDLVEPNTGFNAEGGVKAALSGGRFNLSGSGFYIKQINVPAYDYDAEGSTDPSTGATCCFLSDGSKYTSRGVEFQLQGAATPRLNIDLSYTLTDFRYEPGSLKQALRQAIIQPRHMAKLWAAWQPPVADRRLTIGAGVHAESGVEANWSGYEFVPGVGFAQVTYVTPRDGYVTADTMVKYRITDRIGVQLNVDNIFDRTYYQTVQTGYRNYYGTPRSFLLTLRGSL